MPVPHIPVRHRTTGEERTLPETALRHFPDWERTDEQATATSASDEATDPAGDEPTSSTTTRSSKGRASAKDTKE